MRLEERLDAIVLGAFLVTSAVASQLFHRISAEGELARERAAELESLASLGMRAMTAVHARDALQIVSVSVREHLGATGCRVHTLTDGRGMTSAGDPDGPENREPVTLAMQRGMRVAVLAGGPLRVIPDQMEPLSVALGGQVARRLLIPLRGGTEVIGVLDVEGESGLVLDSANARVLDALVYYAASAAERARLERAGARLEALQGAEEMRAAVLASVSHDLRTPLTTIKALASQLHVMGDDRSEVIEQEADRLNRFVGEMLDMSRLTSGGFVPRPEVAPVEELVVGALQQVEGSFGERRIDVRMPAHDPLPLAWMDMTHTVRIVVNLLENARKYSPGESPVELVVESAGAQMHISVCDRGPGIAPSEVNRIFDALYRPATARADAGSAGLGLAIARGLARAQGGDVVWTERPGGGSIFTLTLPAATVADLDPPRPGIFTPS